MSTNQTTINPLLQELAELKSLESDLKAEIEAKQDLIKAYLNSNNLTEYLDIESGHKVTFKTVQANRLQTKRLESDLGKDVLAEYYSISEYKKFTFK